MKHLMLAASILIASSCGHSFTEEEARSLARHAAIYNGHGELVDPSSVTARMFSEPNPLETAEEREARFNKGIRTGLANFAMKKSCGVTKERPCRVVIFVHGGLNEQSDAAKRAVTLAGDIGDDDAYSIAINWRGALLSNVWDHVVHVRQGRYRERRSIASYALVPGLNLIRGIAYSPLMLLEDLNLWRVDAGELRVAADNLAHEEICRRVGAGWFGPPGWERDCHSVPIGTETSLAHMQLTGLPGRRRDWVERWISRHGLESIGQFTKSLINLPLKLATGVFIEGFGTPAWDEMKRKNELLFQQPADAKAVAEGRPLAEQGGVPVLMRRLAEIQHAGQEELVCEEEDPDCACIKLTTAGDSTCLKVEFDLIGHSMGGFVVNRILERGVAQPRGNVRAAYEEGKTSAVGAAGATDPRAESLQRLLTLERGRIPYFRERELRMEIDRLDRLTRSDAASPAAVPCFRNIVYLSAANSYADYARAAMPYLDQNKETKVHHWLLHPEDEENDTSLAWFAFEPVHRGSLLVWIDRYFEKHHFDEGATAGRYVNFVRLAQNTPAEHRERVFVRVFPPEGSGYPRTHGGMNDVIKPERAAPTRARRGPCGTERTYKFWDQLLYEPPGKNVICR